MRKILLLPFFVLLAACEISSLEAAGEQKIQIRVWVDNTPDVVASDGEFHIAVDQESVVEFDVTCVSNVIYLAYTTDATVYQAVKGTGDWSDDVTTALTTLYGDEGDYTDVTMVQKKITRTNTQYIAYQVVTNTSTYAITTNTEARKDCTSSTTISDNLTWLRMFEGTVSTTSSASYGTITWSQIADIADAAAFTDITILPLPNYSMSMLAVTNSNQLVAFTTSDDEINILTANLASSYNGSVSTINQVNALIQDGTARVAFVVNGDNSLTSEITIGYYNGTTWRKEYNYRPSTVISCFQMKSGLLRPYAVWMKENNQMVLASLLGGDDGTPPLRQIGALNGVLYPKLSTSVYLNYRGYQIEDVLIGTVNNNYKFFELFRLDEDGGLAERGPLILDWNDRYGIASNDVGQVLYVRAQASGQLIFAGLNSLLYWDQLQVNTPPNYSILPSSDIAVLYLNDNHNLTVYQQNVNGSIYFLSGIK